MRCFLRAGVVPLTLALLLCFAALADASLIGPAYPAPGGNGLSSDGGSPVGAGGLTLNYTAFDTSAFTHLYWGAWDETTTGTSLEGLPLHSLAFAGVIGTTAKWTGTTGWYNHYNQQYYSAVPVELDVTVTGTGTWVPATSLGETRADYLWDTAGGNAFTANFQFKANVGAGMQPLGNIQVEVLDYTRAQFWGG